MKNHEHLRRQAKYRLLQILTDLGIQSANKPRTIAWLDVMDLFIRDMDIGRG